jgi:cholesterol transport system auxiliary component
MKVLIALLVVTVSVVGCLQVEKRAPEKNQYAFDVARSGPKSSFSVDAVVAVRKFNVSPPYENKSFVYRTKDLQFESDFYNEFFVTPAAMITEETREWLSASGLFSYVLDPATHMVPTCILEGMVTALYGDYRDLEAPKAVLGIKFFLLRDVGGRTEVVFQRPYEESVSINDASPEVLVRGWNTGLRRIFQQFEHDLAEALQKQAP